MQHTSTAGALPEAAIAQAPLSRTGMAALLLGAVFSAMSLVAAAVLLPGMAHEFATTPHAALLVELVGAMTATGMALGAPTAGQLVDHFGYRSVFLAGLVAFAAFGVLPAVLDDLYLILLSRAALGVSAAAILIAALGGVSGLPDPLRAKLLGYQTFVGGAGAMVLYPIVALIARHGWRPGFLVHLLSLALIPLVLTLPRRLKVAAHVAPRAAGRLSLPLTLIGVAMVIGMIMYIEGTFAPLYLPSLGVTKTGLWAIPPMVGAALGLVFAASYAWLHSRLPLPILFAIALGCSGGGLLISGVSNTLLLFTVGAGVTGAGMTLFSPVIAAAAIALAAPGQAGRTVGLAQGALLCSQAIFPFVAGPIAKAAGLRSIYLVFGAAALLLALGYGLAAFRGSASRLSVKPAGRLNPHPH